MEKYILYFRESDKPYYFVKDGEWVLYKFDVAKKFSKINPMLYILRLYYSLRLSRDVKIKRLVSMKINFDVDLKELLK